jgi:tRNA(fMet)-specific endonuclease VapC
MGLILDTSVLISAERKKFDLEGLVLSLSDESFFMSAITLSELWHGCHRGTGLALHERLKHVKYLEAMIPVLEFGTKEALIHAKIWAALEKIGQGIGLHDLIIGATALAHDHTLATLNEKEFKRIPNLRLSPYVRQFLLK